MKNAADKLLKKYRGYSYKKLGSFIGKGNHAELLDLENSEGEDSQIIIDVFWDGTSGGDIQVTCEIVSGGYKPLLGFLPIYLGHCCDGFIRQADEVGAEE